MRTGIATGVAVAFFCSLALPAFAQSQPAVKERIEVTGTSIKRIDAETALPVQIITSEEIARTGASTTEELLKTVTAITTAGSILVAQNNGTITTSQSTVSLRALGSTRTLVLVNGRRVAVFGGTAIIAVDVNSIPIAAIDRVEVLKDGASSLYGSDAVAGVVNFILKKDYSGAEASVVYGSPTKSGGGKETTVNLFTGFQAPDQRYNVTLGAGWKKTEQIQGSSRAYARQINVGENNDLSSTIAFPGNILFGSTFGSLASPASPNCGPTSMVSPFFVNSATSGRACRFENSPWLSVTSGINNKYVLLNGSFKFNAAVEGYVETGFTRNEISYTTQPVPIAENTQLPSTNPYIPFINNLIATRYPTLPAGLRRFATLGDTLVLLPTTSPYFPTAFVASLGLDPTQPIAFRYRDFVQGQRHTEDDSDNIRLVAGLRGNAAGWDYDSAFMFSQSKANSNLVSGYPLTSAFLELLDTGTINPFGPTTDPTALAAAAAAQFKGTVYSSKTSSTGVDAKASRDLVTLPGGTMGMAIGGSVIQEKYTFNPSSAFQVGDIGGFGGNVLPVDKSRHVSSAFAEVAAPIVKNLELDLGVRFDDYQRTGTTTNPKLSFRLTPSQELLVRGSIGTGFRAPSLTDLYTPQAASVTANGSRDPIRCPSVATGSPADCNNQFPTVTGGNPDLKPEKSLSRTLGVLFEPNPTVSIGVDAFWIRLKDSITPGGLAPAFILGSVANATQYAAYILRGAPDGNASGVGPIIGIVATTSNLFKQFVSGWDTNIRITPLRTAEHRLVLRLDGTYLMNFDQQNPDNTYSSGLNTALRAGGGVVPRWRHVATATYTRGPWEASLQQNFQESYNDILGNLDPATKDRRSVGAYETFDVRLAYTGIRSMTLVLGAKNIKDRDPPYTNEGGQFAAGYDVTYADVRGRFVYGGITYKFK